MAIDIELISTEELLIELMKRMDHAIFSGLRVVSEYGDGHGDQQIIHYKEGCALTCAGLAADIGRRCLEIIGTDPLERE